MGNTSTGDFRVQDIYVNKHDAVGELIQAVYSKNPSLYVVYLSANRVSLANVDYSQMSIRDNRKQRFYSSWPLKRSIFRQAVAQFAGQPDRNRSLLPVECLWGASAW